MELCSCAALHMDPQGLALHHYKSAQPQDDIVGRKAFLERYSHFHIVLQSHTCMYSVCVCVLDTGSDATTLTFPNTHDFVYKHTCGFVFFVSPLPGSRCMRQ